MKLGKKFICFVFLFVIQAGIVFCDESSRVEVKTDLRLDQTPLHVGSKITYTVRIEWTGSDEEDGIKFIPPHFETRGLEIKNSGVSAESVPEDEGKIRQIRTFTYELQATQKGQAVIEDFPLEYLEEGKSGTQVIEVPGRTFEIEGEPFRVPILWLAMGLAGAGAAALGMGYWRVRKSGKLKTVEMPERDPARETLEKIESLEPLLKEGQYVDYVTKISRELTEFLKKVREEDLTKEERKLLADLSERVTELKFAQHALGHSEVHEFKRRIESFVETRKIEEV